MNHVSLFFKSCLDLFLTHIMTLRFYTAPPQIVGFFGTVLGIFAVSFVRALNIVTMAVLSSYNFLKQACICLCNYYENVLTVS